VPYLSREAHAFVTKSTPFLLPKASNCSPSALSLPSQCSLYGHHNYPWTTNLCRVRCRPAIPNGPPPPPIIPPTSLQCCHTVLQSTDPIVTVLAGNVRDLLVNVPLGVIYQPIPANQ
jgi:hypothetical protein